MFLFPFFLSLFLLRKINVAIKEKLRGIMRDGPIVKLHHAFFSPTAKRSGLNNVRITRRDTSRGKSSAQLRYRSTAHFESNRKNSSAAFGSSKTRGTVYGGASTSSARAANRTNPTYRQYCYTLTRCLKTQHGPLILISNRVGTLRDSALS